MVGWEGLEDHRGGGGCNAAHPLHEVQRDTFRDKDPTRGAPDGAKLVPVGHPIPVTRGPLHRDARVDLLEDLQDDARGKQE